MSPPYHRPRYAIPANESGSRDSAGRSITAHSERTLRYRPSQSSPYPSRNSSPTSKPRYSRSTLDDATRRLVDQGRGGQAGHPARLEQPAERGEREAGVDDVLHHDDMPPLERDLGVHGDPHPPLAAEPGQRQEVHLGGHRDVADEVGGEDHGALQHTDQHRVEARVVDGDLLPQPGHPLGEAVLIDHLDEPVDAHPDPPSTSGSVERSRLAMARPTAVSTDALGHLAGAGREILYRQQAGPGGVVEPGDTGAAPSRLHQQRALPAILQGDRAATRSRATPGCRRSGPRCRARRRRACAKAFPAPRPAPARRSRCTRSSLRRSRGTRRAGGWCSACCGWHRWGWA